MAGCPGEAVLVIDPAIETHYGTGYERSRLFPGGQPSLEYVRSMELLERLLPAPRPGSWMWAGARGPMPRRWPGAGTGCTWSIRCRCTWTRPARKPAPARPPGSPPRWATRASSLGPGASQDAVLLFGPLYHLAEAGSAGRPWPRRGGCQSPAAACWRWRCPGSPRCWTGCMRTGWMTRSSGRSWTRIWSMASTATPIRPAAVLHHRLLPYPRRPGRRDRAGWLHRRDRLRSRGPGLVAAPRMDRPAAARAHPVRRTFRRDSAVIGFSHHLIAAATKT